MTVPAAVIDPTSLGFDVSRLKRIDSWMQRYVDEGKYSGSSILVARNGEVAHLATVGQRSVDQGLPYELDTVARFYSMTKPIVTAGLMMLVERGHFNLEAPISRFIPEFENCRALVSGATSADDTEAVPCPTVHQILTHTSGLSYDFNGGLIGALYTDNRINFQSSRQTLAEKTRALADMPLSFSPGTTWQYSVGIDVAGRIIEVVTGRTLDEYLRTEILDPLGMSDTSFGVRDDQLDRFADCYMRTETEKMALMETAADSRFRESAVACFSGGGGLVSTLGDYYRFTEMLRLHGSVGSVRLLSPRIVRFMMSNHLPGEIASFGPKSFLETPMHGVGFGLGGSVVLDPARMRTPGSVGDFSWGGMASTFFWIDPVEQLTCIFVTQLVPSSSWPSRTELKALVHGALVG